MKPPVLFRITPGQITEQVFINEQVYTFRWIPSPPDYSYCLKLPGKKMEKYRVGVVRPFYMADTPLIDKSGIPAEMCADDI